MATNNLTNNLNSPIYYPPTPTLHPVATTSASTSASAPAPTSASTSTLNDQTALVDLTHDDLPSTTTTSFNRQHAAPTEPDAEPSRSPRRANADDLSFQSFYQPDPPAYTSPNTTPHCPCARTPPGTPPSRRRSHSNHSPSVSSPLASTSSSPTSLRRHSRRNRTMVSYVDLDAPEVEEQGQEGSPRREGTSEPIPEGLEASVEAKMRERGARE